MTINEKEVRITSDGLGRAAIVERSDGLFCIYTHWMWSKTGRDAFNLEPIPPTSWTDNNTPLNELYQDISPEPGIYATLSDARSALFNLPGFVASDDSKKPTAR